MTRFLFAAIAVFLGSTNMNFVQAQEVSSGCTDSAACNFNMEATSDDGSCAYTGCNDPAACNFNGLSLCTVDCIYPALGEDCNGGGDLCGPGTFWNANTQRCEVLLVGDSDADGCMTISDLLSMLSMFGLCVDVEAQTFACGVDHVTFDGHDYATVQIGEDCWFAENLRTTIYANGDSILNVSNGQAWQDVGLSQLPAMTAMGYDSLEVVDARGFWYNSYAAHELRGLCPVGWHVSTEQNWVNMEAGLGAESVFWPNSGLPFVSGFVSTGLSSVPAGYIKSDEGAVSGGLGAYLWSVVPAVPNSKQRRRIQSNGFVNIGETSSLGHGFSVRCVQH